MKRKVTNKVVFVLISCFVMSGFFSRHYLAGFKYSLIDLIQNKDFESFTERVDDTAQNMSYNGSLINANSLIQRLIGNKMIEKDDATVVLLNNEFLEFTESSATDKKIKERAEECLSIKEQCDSMGTPFLYVHAPEKNYFDEYIESCSSAGRDNYIRFEDALEERGIGVLSVAELMYSENLGMEECYYVTDHHWLPETGFWMTEEICKALALDYDADIFNLENYNVEVYEDWFLGSQGKKTGLYFTKLGADDFRLLVPDFPTQFKVITDGEEKRGGYSQTLIRSDYYIEKDYYNLYSYAAYMGGDHGLQIVKNQLINNGKKVLLIRDSYACVVSPFLSLAVEEQYILDPRHFKGTEQSSNIEEYIREINPDYVVILYSSSERFDNHKENYRE